MLVYVASSSLDLNWLVGVLGLGETRAPNSHQSNNLLQQFILLLVIIIGIGWLLYQLVKNRETNNPNEEDHTNYDELLLDHYFQSLQGEQEHPSGVLEQYFDGDDRRLSHRTTTPGGDARRYDGCAFCGKPCARRCSRCKAARLCSMECQIRHWRSGHKNECSESETAADQGRATHDHGTSKHVKNSERVRELDCVDKKLDKTGNELFSSIVPLKSHGWRQENVKENTSNGSHGDGVSWSLESGVSEHNDVSNIQGCEVCGSPSTTGCSRCNAIKYCSTKCLVMNWRWHKDRCIAADVNSAQTKRPQKDVVRLSNSYEEGESSHSSTTLSLEFCHDGTIHLKSPIKVSQDPTKKAKLHRTEGVKYLVEEVAKSRNEILLLQSERDEWKKKANFAREQYQSIKRESNYQLSVLKNEKASVSEAEKKACNAVHSLQEKLNQLQKAMQENLAEKRKLEEDKHKLENEKAKLKKELQEEHKRAQYLVVESDKSREIAQVAKREVEKVRQELKEAREHAQRLTENFRRDVAESKAAFVEAKLNDLHGKIKFPDSYKVCSICLSNEKDLAFGCGHMTCRDCGSKLSKCPICRKKITNHIRLFTG